MTLGSEMDIPAIDEFDITMRERISKYKRTNASEAKLIEAIADGFAPVIREAIDKAVQPLIQRIADLESRVGGRDAR